MTGKVASLTLLYRVHHLCSFLAVTAGVLRGDKGECTYVLMPSFILF